MLKQTITYIAAALLLASCSMESAEYGHDDEPTRSADRLLVLCEGLWGMDNSCIALVDSGRVTDKWFQQNNPGQHLGDTGNDIIMVNDTLIAVSVNWSNIIQYIRPDGRAIAATEDIPNNRRLATDGSRYIYCTSYADGGYVAKIDIATKAIVDTCHVGREPEGIAYYDGRLFVANTGGYAFQEKLPYEQTISVVDAATMRELRRIDTGCINLYGNVSQSGQWLCVNSAGDYYGTQPQTVVVNMANEEFKVFPFPSTYNCAHAGRFYCIGSSFSYTTGQYAYSLHTITLPSLEADEGLGQYANAATTIMQMQSPYGIYISPYSAHLYATDARAYATNGYLHEFDTGGNQVSRVMLRGLNPAHFLALP